MARQLNVQRSSTGKVAQALQGLTSYLMTENDRLDAEQQEEQINLAAQSIAEGFQALGPNPSIEAIQKRNFESISEAASLGALGENMPLISSLFQNTLNTRELRRQEGQDEALSRFAAEQFGITTPGLSGRDAISVAQTKRQLETREEVVDKTGKTFALRFDNQGNQIHELQINALGLDSQFEFGKRTALFQFGLDQEAADRDLARKKDLLGFENEFASTAQFGLDPIEGFKFSEGLEGASGEPIYTLKGGMGGPYTINDRGEPVMYHGTPHRRKGIGGSTGDSLKQLADLRKTLGSDVHKQAQVLLRSEGGAELIASLTGLTSEEITDEKGQLRFEFTQGLENLISAGQFETQLANVRSELGEPGQTVKGEPLLNQAQELAIGELKVAASNFANVKSNILNQIPAGPYGTITNIKEWNASSELIRNVFDPNSNMTATQRGMIQEELGKLIPQPEHSLGLQYEDFKNLDFGTQENLIKFLYPFIKNR